MLKDNISKEKYSYFIFLLILLALTSLMIYCFMPLNSLNYGHDTLFHYRRMLALMTSLKEGTFPVYLDYTALDNYGYGTNFFYPYLLLIPFALFANLTNYVVSYKLLLFIITIFCGSFTYKFIYKIYKNINAAWFGALLYTFSIYRLQDMFERGALGEAISFTIIPIIALGVYEVLLGNYKKWYILSIGFTLLIYTHLLSSILTFVIALLFICIYNKSLLKQTFRIKYFIISGFVTILLCLSFLLPFIEQILTNNFYYQNDIFLQETTLNLKSFIRSIIFPYSTYSSFPFEPFIGIFLILILLTRIFIKNNKYLKSADIFVLVGLILLVLTTSIFPWDKYPLKLINVIQFPWRLFEYSTFLFSIAGGLYLALFFKKKIILFYLLLIVYTSFLIIISANVHKKVYNYETYNLLNVEMNSDNYTFFYVGMQYIPSKLKSLDILKEKGNKIDYKNSSTSISDIEKGNGYINFNIKTLQKEEIELPLIYYKGYSAQLYNERMKMPINLKVRQSNRGLVEIELPSNPRLGNITVKFSGTFIQKYSIYFTLISFILLIIYIYRDNKKLKKNNNA